MRPTDLPAKAGARPIPDHARGKIHAIPAELVHLHLVDMPVRSARQRLDVLPFALEDRVAQPLDAVHCAILGTGAGGAVLAATLARDTVEAALEAHPGLALVPEQMLLAAPAPGADGAIRWHTLRDGPRVLVRCSDLTGFAARADMLPLLWVRAGRPAVVNLAQPLPDGITCEEARNTGTVTPDILGAADLRQGIYRPSRGLARPLKWLAASVAVAALAHLAILIADTSAQARIADGLRAEAGTALAARFPAASPDDPPALLLRQLAAQSAGQRGSGFLPVMTQVSDALGDGATPIQFRELTWTEDALRLTVEAPDLETLQNVQARLGDAGLDVSSGSATAGDGAARAELTVRP